MRIRLLNPNLPEPGSASLKLEKSSFRIDGGMGMGGWIGWDDGRRTERRRKREKETIALRNVRPFYP